MPLMDLFWAMLWFFMWIVWIWLLISIFADIFRSEDLSGWGKAAWVLFTVVLPLFGVLVYLIARGQSMQERATRVAVESEKATRAYIKEVAGTSTTEELQRLAQLRHSGALSEAEFQTQKDRVLAP
jgi:hypothetical protein